MIEAFRKVSTLNRSRFSYYNNTFLRALSYFNPEINLEAINKKEEEMISTLVSQSICYLFQADNPLKYVKYLDKI